VTGPFCTTVDSRRRIRTGEKGFSQNAQPTATAPERGGRLVWVFEPSSAGYLAVHYRGNWQMLREARDNRTGTTRLEMTGEAICNPVAWASS
jgi:hypothetical protein